MVKITPPIVLVHESVYKSELTKNRLDRMMQNIETDDFRIVNDFQLNEAIKQNGWLNYGAKRTGEIKRTSDPAIIFNTFRFAENEEFRKISEKYPYLRFYNFLGDGHWTFRNKSNYP